MTPPAEPEAPALGPPRGVLSPGAVRILYAMADAWHDAGPVRDVWPHVERRLRARGVPTVRRTWLLLRAVEWLPVFAGGRRFWFLPRAERRARLEQWETRGWPGHARLAELRSWIEEAHSSDP
ncbi:MAG: hypothetical protein OEP95_05820 [Myxococcales bacterium]|nr:hypothetical protein [Myxococcales bacterium]